MMSQGTQTRGVGEVVDDEPRDVPRHPDARHGRSSRRRAARRFRIYSFESFLASTFLEQYHARIGYRLQTLFWDESFTLEQP
jgi:hypothetical protein